MNRAIRARSLSAIYVTGPGHGGPGLVASAYLDGTYSEVYPHIGRDEEGLRRLFRQFSFPGGIPSHVAPETPGSIHEGGELGYSLLHAYGAVLDNPDLLAVCVVGDGEAETGPLAASWHSNKFLNPATDGAVLPVLHLNGYKIANPTVLARIERDELRALLEGYGYAPRFVEGSDPEAMHQLMAATLDEVLDQIGEIQATRSGKGGDRPAALADDRPPDPKGWTGPKEVDGLPTEGSFRSHQVPLAEVRTNPRASRAAGVMDALLPTRRAVRRGGRCAGRGDGVGARGGAAHERQPARQRRVALAGARATRTSVPTRSTSRLPRRHQRGDARARRVAARRGQPPIATASGSWAPTKPSQIGWGRCWTQPTASGRRGGSMATITSQPQGQVMEVLSEHLCQGWLEGYLLTGRHGLFNCYEAFIHIVDAMFNQHAKWLKVARQIPWRRPIPSLNYLLSSHVWRQDHNGFSHQDPGLHRPRGQQKGGDHPRLLAARRQLPACRWRTTACASATTST